jgi:hypothetical protein
VVLVRLAKASDLVQFIYQAWGKVSLADLYSSADKGRTLDHLSDRAT